MPLKSEGRVSFGTESHWRLTHIQRVWVLTQTAKLLAKTNREKASSLLTLQLPRRSYFRRRLDRPRALFAIANALRRSNLRESQKRSLSG